MSGRRRERGIREPKANYSVEEALLQHSRVAQLQAPNKRVLGALKQMFTQGGCRILDGKAREYLDQKHELDLIALKSSSGDVLSNYLRKTWAVKVNDGNILKRVMTNRVCRKYPYMREGHESDASTRAKSPDGST